MKKSLVLFVLVVLAGLLSACGAPAASPSPASTTANLIAVQPTAAAPTQLPASPTPEPATATSVPPTETKVPGPVITLSQVHMLDATNGWAWGPKTDTTFRLLRTADGGQTWLDVSPKPDSTGYYGGFFLNAQDAWVPLNDATSGAVSILRTVDGGKTWESLPANDFLQNSSFRFTTATDGIAEAAGVGAGNLYLNYYETHDGGTSWKPILLTAPNPEPGLQPGTVHLCNICGDGLSFDPARQVITYGSLANDPTGNISLAISTDLGQHWKDIKLPLTDQKYAKGLVGPQSPVFFGQNGVLPVKIQQYKSDGTMDYNVLAVYTSSDGGQTWKAAPSVLENTATYDLVQVISDQVAFVRCGKNLCATSDGAKTWKTLPDMLDFDSNAGGPDYVSQYAFIDPQNGYAITGQDPTTSLWHTSDGGQTWNKLSPSLAQ
jgi:photosystem II stability/assembly factor-like uncharacterized protein